MESVSKPREPPISSPSLSFPSRWSEALFGFGGVLVHADTDLLQSVSTLIKQGSPSKPFHRPSMRLNGRPASRLATRRRRPPAEVHGHWTAR